ncbi:MAG: hypothetical protein JNM66_01055 [Bryobacterales bacterium]|nr:hypothetical protein [Bryobacterales bacterium]
MAKMFRSLVCIVGLASMAAPGQELPPLRNTVFGINYVPAHVPESTDADAVQALLECRALGGHLSYIWEWPSGDKGLNDGAKLAAAAKELGFELTLQMSPTAIGAPVLPSGLQGTSFRDPDVRSRYLDDIGKMARLEADYFILAAEINLLYEVNPREFDSFVTLYREAYKLVKGISPKTKVGVSLHMDMLFSFSQFSILPRLEPQDFIGLTSYPHWLVADGVYKSVEDIPLWYYKRLRLLIAKPIIFTEIAWPTGGRSSIEQQTAFVKRLPELMRGVNPEVITWALQHDVKHFQTRWLTEQQIAILLGYKVDPEVLFDELNTMGLLSWDGPPKPAWLEALNYPLRSK